jgi:hypothetical protein
MRNNAYLNSGRTIESDEVLTPAYAVEPIVKYLKIKKYSKIWCPFDFENSQYVRVLRKERFVVYPSILAEGKDFLNFRPEFNFDCIVSNPPFSIKDRVLQRCYEIGKPFALLLPQNSLQGKNRGKLFIKYGLEYLGFDKRICFYTRGDLTKIKFSNHFASGYFCHNVLPCHLLIEELNQRQEAYEASK